MKNIKIATKQLLLLTKVSKFTLKPINKIPKKLTFSLLKKAITMLEKLEDEKKLLTEGYILKFKPIVSYSSTCRYKIAYILNNALPFSNNGYAIRSHHILKSVKNMEMDILAITRVGFPLDISILACPLSMSKLYDGMVYHRLDREGFRLHDTVLSKYIDNYVYMLVEFMQKEEITLAHGASDYLTGLATVYAAKTLDIPSIYEVRGFWEITRASREKLFRYSDTFKMMKKLEIQACNEATTIIALSEVVKEELIARGIDIKKIYVVPNAVDTSKLKPIKKDFSLMEKLGIDEKFIIGFVGSVVDYEGLDDLVKVAKKIETSYPDKFRYLIVGDGNALEKLKKKVSKLKLTHLFTFTGRVPYEEVEKYYSVMDTACYPRLDWEVCRIVSPKKPLEAMSYAIPIIASSVRANSYFIEDEVTGLVYDVKNMETLKQKILSLYTSKDLRDSISSNARKWVVENRDSSITGKLMKDIYEKTILKFQKEVN